MEADQGLRESDGDVICVVDDPARIELARDHHAVDPRVAHEGQQAVAQRDAMLGGQLGAGAFSSGHGKGAPVGANGIGKSHGETGSIL